MKLIGYVFILFSVFIGCNQNQSYLGHWKCDKTGTITGIYQNGTQETRPISELYSILNSQPIEFEILSDGIFIKHNEGGTQQQYTTNYQGDPLKLLLLDSEGNGNGIISFSRIDANEMELNINALDDETKFDIVVNRVY